MMSKHATLSQPPYQGRVFRNLYPHQGRVFRNLEVKRSDLHKRITGSGGSGNPETSLTCARNARAQGQVSEYPTLPTLSEIRDILSRSK